MGKQYYVYIMASRKNGTLYIGVTSDFIQRVYQHKHKYTGGFTAKYDVSSLVYYETYSDPENAITREKNIKAWKRAWKIELIESKNPAWNDLYEEITGFQLSLE